MADKPNGDIEQLASFFRNCSLQCGFIICVKELYIFSMLHTNFINVSIKPYYGIKMYFIFYKIIFISLIKINGS